jgi:hypothetical protein
MRTASFLLFGLAACCTAPGFALLLFVAGTAGLAADRWA